VIALEGIAKRLSGFHLREISLEIGAGEYFVLLGPSGVGKTVLLELVAGLHLPDAGRVLLRGADITREPPERRGFALVYQDYALFEHMSVLDNIAYGLRARGAGRTAAASKAAEAAGLMGVGELIRRRPGTLSGGEKQRVALARAMVTAPDIVLLDEPLAAVDRQEGERLRKVLRSIQAESGATFLHVTHNVDEALYLADRIGVMLGGRLVQAGPAASVFEAPASREVAGFLGLRNVLSVERMEGERALVNGVGIAACGASERARSLWVRPEDVILSCAPFESSARNQFPCEVVGWESAGRLLEVEVTVGELRLVALVTRTSFEELGITRGSRLHCTFKSTAVHCF
jgi:molybdate/tungstate transport system ATP-binding protein